MGFAHWIMLLGLNAGFGHWALLRGSDTEACCLEYGKYKTAETGMAHIRPSKPDYGLGIQMKVLKTFQAVPVLLGSGVICVPLIYSMLWFLG